MLRFEMSSLVAQTLEFCLTPLSLFPTIWVKAVFSSQWGGEIKMHLMLPESPVSLIYSLSLLWRSRISGHLFKARDLSSFLNLSLTFSFHQEQLLEPSLPENVYQVSFHRLQMMLEWSETKRFLSRDIFETPMDAYPVFSSLLCKDSCLVYGVLNVWTRSEFNIIKHISY